MAGTRLLGLSTALKALNDFGDKMQDAAKEFRSDATERVAEEVRKAAPRKTGDLARRIEADKKAGAVRLKAPHSHLVEFGWRNAPAKPFARPTLRRMVPELTKDFQKRMKDL